MVIFIQGVAMGVKFLECDEVTGTEVKDISKLLDHPKMTIGVEVDNKQDSKLGSLAFITHLYY